MKDSWCPRTMKCQYGNICLKMWLSTDCCHFCHELNSSCMQRWGAEPVFHILWGEAQRAEISSWTGSGFGCCQGNSCCRNCFSSPYAGQEQPFHRALLSQLFPFSLTFPVLWLVTVWLAVTWHWDNDGAVWSVINELFAGAGKLHMELRFDELTCTELLHCNDLRCI